MGIFAIIQTVLTILSEYLQWQVALTKINARKLAYDLDQQILEKGAALQKQIDGASNAGDLVVVDKLRNDYQAYALYASGVKLLIPDYAGRNNVGISPTVPVATEPERAASDGVKPTPRAVPVEPVGHNRE
jgi:hypothetical protein